MQVSNQGDDQWSKITKTELYAKICPFVHIEWTRTGGEYLFIFMCDRVVNKCLLNQLWIGTDQQNKKYSSQNVVFPGDLQHVQYV